MNCNLQYDACGTMPCQNDGTCVDHAQDHGFDCFCREGWDGDTCTIDIDECESTPCAHGGQCVEGIDSYSCRCIEGFSNWVDDVRQGDTCINIVVPCTAIQRAQCDQKQLPVKCVQMVRSNATATTDMRPVTMA